MENIALWHHQTELSPNTVTRTSVRLYEFCVSAILNLINVWKTYRCPNFVDW